MVIARTLTRTLTVRNLIALEEEEADRRLYLAVPLDIYKRFFKYPFIQTVISRNEIPLLVPTFFPNLSGL
ncbi:MAG: hypothetical protein GDA44_00720 [Prochloron sp. SP5CPC1]|nr:hypothetical protein [Candidatus Paraprochloron terpiosi SP5CPC1]